MGWRKLAALVAATWFVLGAPAMAQTTVRVVAHADLKVLDPIWTTAYITRNFGYMIYDVLFAKDANLEIRPQMADHYTVSDDKLTYTIVLRDGLVWSDGTPVTSEDCIASIKRWAARDSYGQLLMRDTAELKAIDDKSFALTLKRPFGFVIDALGKVSSNVPFMMPKRVAETDPYKQITDFTGSGPFIFKKDEWKPGEKVVFVKNPKYKPRSEPPSMLAGGKVAKVDRVEWLAIPDPSTAVNALLAGEIDLIESPPPDLFPILKADKNVELYPWNAQGSQIVMRFNALQPPFNNVKARQAATYAIAQEDLLRAQVGDPAIYKVCNAPFICGTRFGKEYGDLLIKPNLEKARQLLKESGYDGTPVVMMHQTDLQSSNNVQPVAKQQLEKAGFKVDLQSMDWQTVVTRRAKKDPPGQGGWNIFFTTTITLDADNPGTNPFASAACEKAWFGWPCDPETEKLRDAFMHETDPVRQKELAAAISDRVMEQAYYAPVGQYKAFGAYRKDRLQGWLSGPALVMWNISKKQ
ncbi:ABC transporter substrate-binding protein [Reyranella sp.]|uniref:ABC transporter substrate-binding protein n=1 Tax=Reyranella sp. TaxID=1929291 RepID=UPI002F9505E3